MGADAEQMARRGHFNGGGGWRKRIRYTNFHKTCARLRSRHNRVTDEVKYT